MKEKKNRQSFIQTIVHSSIADLDYTKKKRDTHFLLTAADKIKRERI